MVMLPRNMISPIVSPSHGTGCIVAGSSTVIASCSGVRTPWRPLRSARRSIGMSVQASCLEQTPAGPVDLGQAIDMGQFDADLLGALDDRGGRRGAGDLPGDAVGDARRAFRPAR